MDYDKIEVPEYEVNAVRRFDKNGWIDIFLEELLEVAERGLSGYHLHNKWYQFKTKLENDWYEFEKLCDAKNINQAFALMKEAETEKEKKELVKYYKTTLKEMGAHYWSKPITWKKEWDA